jgi:hypothetical protein
MGTIKIKFNFNNCFGKLILYLYLKNKLQIMKAKKITLESIKKCLAKKPGYFKVSSDREVTVTSNKK